MKSKITILFLLLYFWNPNPALAQEWKTLKTYQQETGHSVLEDGCWLKKDRKSQNEVWQKANVFNLNLTNGNTKYKTITQIRDFYQWFDLERVKQGHEIKWIGITKIVVDQLSHLDSGFIRFFIVRNKEVVEFGNVGCTKTFEFAFPQLREVYFSKEILRGKAAETWDTDYGTKEQCVILEPLYKHLSPKALCKLNRMAKGKGIYSFVVPTALQYVGDIENCKTRFEYGMYKVGTYNPKK